MKLEEKYAIALAVLSILLLAIGWGVSKAVATAPNSVVRLVVPVAALATVVLYAVFVAIARFDVKG